MTRFALRKIALGLIVAPLALGLAACDKAQEGTAPAASEPLAKVAAPAGTKWSEVIAKTPDGGYRMGNPEAPIKLVEFGALSCSHCAQFAAESFDELRNEYVDSGRVSYELRFFMINPLDIPATMLATCGSTEAVIPLAEQFWAWQPQMFANLQAKSQAEMDALNALPRDKQFAAVANAGGMTEFFASRGIAQDQASACLADTAKAKAIADGTQTASEKFQINGTPSFLLNGTKLDSMGWNDLKAQIQKAGAR